MRVIRRGDAVRPLPPHARLLADLTFEVGDVRHSLSDYMAHCRTAGLLILKDGKIALERYRTSSSPERRWQSYSTAKSITSTLVGAAPHDGAIGSLDDRCDLYPPRVRGSAYEGGTLRNAMADVLGRGLGGSDGRSDVPKVRVGLHAGGPPDRLGAVVGQWPARGSCDQRAKQAALAGRIVEDDTLWLSARQAAQVVQDGA